MAIEFNDNIHVKINRPTDFRFGPFESIAQANSLIPIAQRYHGLLFGVYTDPLDIANSDIDLYYYYNGLTDTDVIALSGSNWTLVGTDIYRDSRVLIGATTFTDSNAKLEVSGRVSQVGLGTSTHFGFEAGLDDDLTNNYNTSYGYQALKAGGNSGGANTAVGYQSLLKTTADLNTSIGYLVLPENTTGRANTAVGALSQSLNTSGEWNTSLGVSTFRDNTTGSRNTAIGLQAGLRNTTGNNNLYIGCRAGEQQTTGSNNTIVGSYFTGITRSLIDNSVIIGTYANTQADGETNEIVIGYNTLGNGSNTTTIGNTSIVKTYLRGKLNIGGLESPAVGTVVGIGMDSSGNIVEYSYTPPAVQWIDTTGGIYYSNDIGVGTSTLVTGRSITAASDIQVNSLRVGRGAGNNISNAALGDTALDVNTTGFSNLALGQLALSKNTSGFVNAGVGPQSLRENTTGLFNTAVGGSAMQNNTTGSWNSSVGVQSLASSLSSYNSGFGGLAISNIETGSNHNTAVGYGAGSTTNLTNFLYTANQSVFVGSESMSGVDNVTNSIVIGYRAVGQGSNTTVVGNSSTVKTYLKGTLNIGGLSTPAVGTVTGIGIDTDGNIVEYSSAPSLPPVDGSYADEAAMIADQANQTAQYIYYDGTSYWEYLGTTNGDITDYRQLGGVPDIYESLTFTEVQTLISTNSLIPGKAYLINDFQTIHQIPYTTDINTGPVEPLVTIATSVNELSTTAWSLTYPTDQISVDWSKTLAEDGITPRAGMITDRYDPINDVYVGGYDWRNVKFRRWKILSKRKETVTSLSGNELDCLLSINTYLPSSLPSTIFMKHVDLSSITANDAGEITITLRNGTYTYTLPLLKNNGSSVFSENELVNTKGQFVYCGVRNAIVFMNQSTFGEYIVGSYWSPVPTTYNTGHQLSYEVDPLDFVDYHTLNPAQNNYAVEIGAMPPFTFTYPYGPYSNNVFRGGMYAVKIQGWTYNNTGYGQFNDIFSGSELINCVFTGGFFGWSHFHHEVINCYFEGTENAAYQNMFLAGSNVNISFFVGRFGSLTNDDGHESSNGQYYLTGNMYSFRGALKENFLVYLSGNGGGNGRTNFTFDGALRSVLLGYFYSAGKYIRRDLVSTSIYEIEQSQTYLTSLNLNSLASGTPVSSLGITAEGDIVTSGGVTLAAVADNGNTSPVVLKHPDGVAPEDSATVGQLDNLQTTLEASLNLRTFGIDIDGAGNPIVTGIKGYAIIPYNCEILAWYIVADTVGSIEIDVWKAPSIPTGANSICGADRPKLVSAQENQNETLTAWTINVTSGDVVAFNVVSASTVTKVNLIIKTKVVA